MKVNRHMLRNLVEPTVDYGWFNRWHIRVEYGYLDDEHFWAPTKFAVLRRGVEAIRDRMTKDATQRLTS